MDLVSELKKIISQDQIKSDSESLAIYGKDWTRYYKTNAVAVCFPKTTQEVQKIVKFARKNKIGLVPSGGRTGLSGAAVAMNGELVVSFEKMNKILEFNPIDRTIVCQAGVVTQDLQSYAKDHGAYFPVDFAARGTAMIGGNVATNAGGLNVVRYGLMRDWVAGLQVVTGQGEILNLNQGLVKNATGYDFRHLFVGSEGTLGFITEITLRVTTAPKQKTVMILGLDTLDDTLNVYSLFKTKIQVSAFEIFTYECLKYVLENHSELLEPLAQKVKYYLLIEAETSDELPTTFEMAFEKNWVQDGVISQSETQAQNFWKYRDHISESLSKYTPYKNDISVKTSQVTKFMIEADSILKKEYPKFEVVWFGHIGDGNLHINILKPKSLEMPEFVKHCQHADQILFSLIQKFQGSISAEHGVGLSKKPFLQFTRSHEEIKLMKGIKVLFDPDNIMNPGKIFDL